MRIHFDLPEFAPFEFEVEGVKFTFSSLKPLAQKTRVATNISEFVYWLPNGKYVYLTVVGDEDQTSAYGIHRGWYVAEVMSEEDAKFAIDAFAKFTALYNQ